MKKKGLAISAVAVSLAAAAVFAGGDCQTVRAADVADGTSIDLGLEGDYVEKSLSKADREAIANQLGYEYFSGDVAVCGSNTTAYVDWENSSIPYWKVYQTEVFMPDLSRDADGNLVVKMDGNGALATKENGLYGRQEVYSSGYDKPSVFQHTVIWGDYNFSPSPDGQKPDGHYLYAENQINQNMGLKTYECSKYDGFKYLGKETKNIEDVYIIRVYYTTDDKLNYTLTVVVNETGHGAYDINGIILILKVI